MEWRSIGAQDDVASIDAGLVRGITLQYSAYQETSFSHLPLDANVIQGLAVLLKWSVERLKQVILKLIRAIVGYCASFRSQRDIAEQQAKNQREKSVYQATSSSARCAAGRW